MQVHYGIVLMLVHLRFAGRIRGERLSLLPADDRGESRRRQRKTPGWIRQSQAAQMFGRGWDCLRLFALSDSPHQ